MYDCVLKSTLLVALCNKIGVPVEKDYRIIRVIGSTRMRWIGRVARMGKKRESGKVWWRILKDEDQLRGIGVDGLTVIKWTINCSVNCGNGTVRGQQA